MVLKLYGWENRGKAFRSLVEDKIKKSKGMELQGHFVILLESNEPLNCCIDDTLSIQSLTIWHTFEKVSQFWKIIISLLKASYFLENWHTFEHWQFSQE